MQLRLLSRPFMHARAVCAVNGDRSLIDFLDSWLGHVMVKAASLSDCNEGFSL